MSEKYVVVPLEANTNNDDIGTGLIIAKLENESFETVESDFCVHIPEGFRRIYQTKHIYTFISTNLKPPNNSFDYRLKYPVIHSNNLSRIDDVYEIVPIPDETKFTKGSIIRFSKIPLTKFFMINDGGFLYGPYGYEEKENNTILTFASSNKDGTVYKYDVSEVKKYCFVNTYNKEERHFFYASTKLNSSKEVSDQFNLHDKLSYLFNDFWKQSYRNNSKNDVKKVLGMLDEQKINSHKLAKERLEDVKKHFSSDELFEQHNFSSSFDNDLKDVFLKFLASETDVAQQVVYLYLEKNKEKLLQNEYEKNASNLKEEKDKIVKLQSEKSILQKELENAKNSNTDVLLKENPKYSEKIKEQERKIVELNEKIFKMQKTDSEKEKLETELKNLKSEISKKEIINENLAESISEKKNNYVQSDLKQIEKIKNLKRDLSYLWTISSDKDKDRTVINTSNITEDYKFFDLKQDFFECFYNKMQFLYGSKNFSTPTRNAVLNRLVCYAQSLLCVYAGKPGTGKTLFSEMFANTLAEPKNLCFVSVPKGWENNHDFIGYHNPFSSEFQEAQSGFYSFAKKIFNEPQVPSVCVLDEANLSQMEYYWSDFIKVTDKITEINSIRVGNENIEVPNNLRFLSTINNDETTEVLSPRIIDRSPIIVFKDLIDSSTEMDASNQIKNEGNNQSYFNFENCIDLFGLNKSAAFNPSEREILSEIQKYIPISSRKINAIRNYCHTARELFFDDEDTPQELVALDFCVQQHILPQISGRGQEYLQMLESVSVLFNDKKLVESEKMLEEIISEGKKYKTFTFFFW